MTDGTLRTPYKLTVPFAKHFTFLFQQQFIDETLARVTKANGSYMYPGGYEDVVTNANVGYKLGSTILSAGWRQRHRACCPYDKAVEHFGYGQIKEDFGPRSGGKSMFVFVLTGLRSIDHKQSAAFLAQNAPGYTYADYKGNLWIYRTSLEARVPVAKHFRILAKAGIYGDYFDYQPIPYYYNYVNVGAQAALSPNVTYTLLAENLTQRNQGYPFVAPNAIHRAKIVLRADFKIPF